MKYRYHIVVLFSAHNETFVHSFNSDSKILKSSEIRSELIRKGRGEKDGYHVMNISKTIND